jgi:hypothetical protein
MAGMKSSTIKKVIRKKLDDWLSSITDATLKQKLKEELIVSGGCITSMLLDEKINDYDIYLKNKNTVIDLANYYINVFNADVGTLKTYNTHKCNPFLKTENRVNIRGEIEERVIVYMKSAGVSSENQETYQYFEGASETHATAFADSLITTHEDELAQELMEDLEIADNLSEDLNLTTTQIPRTIKKKYRPVFFSENAITLSDRVQIVLRFYGNPAQIHKNFDFVHCQCYYDYSEDYLSITKEAYESIISKALIYNGSLYPVASIFRIRKFIERGWRITAGQLLKILIQISKIDLENMSVLREQLIGVDVAYMHQLLEALKEFDGKKIDATYLAKVIDKVFE